MGSAALPSKSIAIVAGGAGFLGSHLCEALLNSGSVVVCIDNFSTGKRENITHLSTNPNFLLLEQDINKGLPDREHFKRHFSSEVSIAYVFHLAGRETHQQEVAEISTLLVNSLGTYNLLEFAKDNQAKFILASTAFSIPSPTNPKDLKNFFGNDLEGELSLQEAKHFAETLTAEYVKNYNLKAVVVRLGEVFGPRMKLDTFGEVGKLIGQALKVEKLTIEGDGLQTSQPTYVIDIVFGLLKATFDQETSGKIFYLAHPKRITLLRLVDALREALGKEVAVEYTKQSLDTAHPFQRVDPTGSLEILGWQPKVALVEGLRKTLESFRVETPLEAKEETKRTKLAPKMPEIKKSHLKNVIVASSLSLIAIAVVSPLLSFYFHTNLAFSNLKESLNLLALGNYEEPFKKADLSGSHLAISNRELANVKPIFQLFKQEYLASELEKYFSVGQNLSLGIKESSLALGNLKKILKPTTQDLSDTLSLAENSLDLAQKELILAELNLRSINLTTLPWFVPSLKAEDLKKILSLRQELDGLKRIYPHLSDVLGLGEDKNFIIVFTNNQFATPIGGAIEDLAILKVFKGRLEVTYPRTDIFHRKIAFSEDPAALLSTLQKNLEKELNLKSSGLLILDDYSLAKINSERKEFINRLVSTGLEGLPELLKNLSPLLEQKHILAYSEEAAMKYLLSQNVLGFRFPDLIEGEDYLYFTRTSLDNSASDPDTEFKYHLKIDNLGDLTANLYLTFVPKKRYKGVVKIYVPRGTQLLKMEGGTGEKIEGGVSDLEKWSVLSFNLELGQEVKTLNLSLKSPYKISLLKETPYTLLIPKQAGLEYLRGEVVFDLPTSVRLTRTNPSPVSYTRPYRILINSLKDFSFSGYITKN